MTKKWGGVKDLCQWGRKGDICNTFNNKDKLQKKKSFEHQNIIGDVAKMEKVYSQNFSYIAVLVCVVGRNTI